MDNWKLVLPERKNSPYLLLLGKYMDRVEKPMLFNLKLDASEQNDLANERPDLVAKNAVGSRKRARGVWRL